jgi:hypothetical protein
MLEGKSPKGLCNKMPTRVPKTCQKISGQSLHYIDLKSIIFRLLTGTRVIVFHASKKGNKSHEIIIVKYVISRMKSGLKSGVNSGDFIG